MDKETRHSREEARAAKVCAVERFRRDADVTSVGLGLTADRTDFAVTITVTTAQALRRLPDEICDVPVRAVVAGQTEALAE